MSKETPYRLVLFVPEADVPEYIAQWDILHRHERALRDHGVRVLSLFEQDGGDDDGDPVTQTDSQRLRGLFRIRPRTSVAVLVDAQGHEMGRFPLPVDPLRIIALAGGDG
jgi:hypothetical protein